MSRLANRVRTNRRGGVLTFLCRFLVLTALVRLLLFLLFLFSSSFLLLLHVCAGRHLFLIHSLILPFFQVLRYDMFYPGWYTLLSLLSFISFVTSLPVPISRRSHDTLQRRSLELPIIQKRAGLTSEAGVGDLADL